MARGRLSFGLLAAASVLVGCSRTSEPDAPDATASPQASAMPAPMSEGGVPVAPSATAPTLLPEGGIPPTPIRGDVPLGADPLTRESTGYTLSAVFRLLDVAGPPRLAEANAAGLEAARRKTELRMGIDLTASRLRLVFGGHGFVLPPETEIRARADRYGHVAVWPGASTYRPLAPGGLRALIGERRLDVAPITSADVTSQDEGGKRIGVRTRKVEISTRAARAVMEVGRQPELGEGGILLCRLLLDLMNAPPGSVVCGVDELPMRVEFKWAGQGGLVFELTGLLKRTDLTPTLLTVPPAGASFAPSPLGVTGGQVLLSPGELAAFRTQPVDVPPPAPGDPDALVMTNGTGQLRLLYLDGVAVAWAAPGAREIVPGPVRGRYLAQWRTFLGDSFEPPVTITVPGNAVVGNLDGGAR